MANVKETEDGARVRDEEIKIISLGERLKDSRQIKELLPGASEERRALVVEETARLVLHIRRYESLSRKKIEAAISVNENVNDAQELTLQIALEAGVIEERVRRLDILVNNRETRVGFACDERSPVGEAEAAAVARAVAALKGKRGAFSAIACGFSVVALGVSSLFEGACSALCVPFKSAAAALRRLGLSRRRARAAS